MALVPQLIGRVGCVVDLSAAFRLRDAALYPQWYGFEHDQPRAARRAAVYGLPERHREALAGARLVATPGCYVTAATLALAPLVRRRAGRADRADRRCRERRVRRRPGAEARHRRSARSTRTSPPTDCSTTATRPRSSRTSMPVGAERVSSERPTHLSAVHTASGADEPGHPRHVLRPPGRRRRAVDRRRCSAALRDAYAGEPFVVVTTARRRPRPRSAPTPPTSPPGTTSAPARVIAIAALDNLTKGASGGAVQSANIALGLAETLGLPTSGARHERAVTDARTSEHSPSPGRPRRPSMLVEALPYIRRFAGQDRRRQVRRQRPRRHDRARRARRCSPQDVVLMRSSACARSSSTAAARRSATLMDAPRQDAEFRDGLRVTDAETVDIARMVLDRPGQPAARDGDQRARPDYAVGVSAARTPG